MPFGSGDFIVLPKYLLIVFAFAGDSTITSLSGKVSLLTI